MTYTMQQLSDLEEIRTLKHRYYRGIDTADMALLEGLFTDDVTVEYRGGGYKVNLSGRANMLDFLANSFHAGCVAMHHGHMPDITLEGPDAARGVWYLEDLFIDLTKNTHTTGSALYHDRYRREDGRWKIAATEYDRIYELVTPIDPRGQLTVHHLARVGRPVDQRGDITHLITWFDEVEPAGATASAA